MQKPSVISIAAVSGGGKTTISQQLISKLNNAKILHFDDYPFDQYPKDICEWVDQGADYNEWNLKPYINDIEFFLHNPHQTLHYILLDYPFAYMNRGLSEYIDLAVYIDTPLDIAMARRILRDFKNNPIGELRNDLAHYLSRAREAYLEMEKTIKPNSDFVIDGSLSPTLIAEQIMEEIRIRGL